MATTKQIPTLTPQRDDESAREFGLRAFRFLLVEELSAAILPTSTLDACLAASVDLLLGETSDVVRERYQRIRFDITSTLHRRRAQLAAIERELNAMGTPEPEQQTPEEAAAADPNLLIVETLRQALGLVMGATGPQEPQGGTKAKLRKPTPKLPPSGTTARPAARPF